MADTDNNNSEKEIKSSEDVGEVTEYQTAENVDSLSETVEATQPVQPPSQATAPTQPSINFNNVVKAIEDNKLYEIITTYFKKKGFTQTLSSFNNEVIPSDTADKSSGSFQDNLVLNYLLNELSSEPNVYLYNYTQLRKFCDESLEIYRPELRSFLFPIFVHMYLDLVSMNNQPKAIEFLESLKSDHITHHLSDLQTLSTIKTVQLVEESEFCQKYRTYRYVLKVSDMGFKLLISFLQDNKMKLVLKIINDHISVEEVGGVPGSGELIDPVVGLTGYDKDQINLFNSQPLMLTLPQHNLEAKEQIEKLLKQEDNFKKRKLTKEEATSYSSLLDKYRKVLQAKHTQGQSRDDFLPKQKVYDIKKAVAEVKDSIDIPPIINSTNQVIDANICFYTFHNTNQGLNCLSISDNLQMVSAGFQDSVVKIWPLKEKEKLRGFKNNFNPTTVELVHDLDRLKVTSGTPYKRLVGHSGPVYGNSFSHDGRLLATCSEDSTVRLWSCDTFASLVVFKGHLAPVWDVDFNPHGHYFVTGSNDRTARMWATDKITPLRLFTGHLSDVDIVKFHNSGRYVATGSSDRTVRLFDVNKGSATRVFTGHSAPVTALALSEDGKYLASASDDHSILLFDIGTGRRISTLTTNISAGRCHALTFSADNHTLISGGDDYNVKLYDLTTSFKEDNPTTVAPLSQPVLEGSRGLKNANIPTTEFPTQRTSVLNLKVTRRNLILAAGVYQPKVIAGSTNKLLF